MQADPQQHLRLTIAHVVGQGVVALSAGCEIHLAVDPCPGGTFDGTCWVRFRDGDMLEHAQRRIGVAGEIAEFVMRHGSPVGIEAGDVYAKLRSGEIALSGSDAEMADGYTLDDVALALDVLRTRWPVVEREVAVMAPAILHQTTRTH